MRKTLRRHTALALAVSMGIMGCAGENAATIQNDAAADTGITIDNETETPETAETYGILNYDYTGYQDECTGWSGYESFVGQDYDNDGIDDRVYREFKEDTEYCHYRIEFGNGDVIDMDRDVYCTGFLDIKAADMSDDGQNEIIISITYSTSTDMRGFGDLVVYEKRGGGYEKAELPFHEETDNGIGYNQLVPIHSEVVHDRLIKVSVENDGYEAYVPINTDQWDILGYERWFDNVTEEKPVWDSYLLEKDGKTQLVCKVHLFDKWSNYGLFAILSYENDDSDGKGRYIVDRWIRVNKEYDYGIDEDSLWALKDYLLCSRFMETGGQTVGVGLWIEEGQYGSAEEIGIGGGVYEENFMGKYYLLVTDEEGTVLSKRYLAQDFGGAERLNFSGKFEIAGRDYNQDSCPDFTIGTFGSTSANIYTLYTIWENGEIGVLATDIPNCSPADFSTAFESAGDKTFYTSIWDNAAGEEKQIVYEWDEVQKLYLEKNLE